MLSFLLSVSNCERHFNFHAQFCAGITSLFERHLKEQNPHLSQLSYDIKDLYNFVDQLVRLLLLSHWQGILDKCIENDSSTVNYLF